MPHCCHCIECQQRRHTHHKTERRLCPSQRLSSNYVAMSSGRRTSSRNLRCLRACSLSSLDCELRLRAAEVLVSPTRYSDFFSPNTNERTVSSNAALFVCRIIEDYFDLDLLISHAAVARAAIISTHAACRVHAEARSI